jgi:hypothetical protein
VKRARAGGEQAARGEARARGLELGEHPADRRKRVVWIDRRSRVEDAGTNEGACFLDVEARAGTTGDARSGRRVEVGAGHSGREAVTRALSSGRPHPATSQREKGVANRRVRCSAQTPSCRDATLNFESSGRRFKTCRLTPSRTDRRARESCRPSAPGRKPPMRA